MSSSDFIGKYQLLEEIGFGGFAVVHKAYDTHAKHTVALKVLHPYWLGDEKFVERFRREGYLMSQLHHPSIVTVYESGNLDDQLYIAMEYLPGVTLNQWLKKTPSVPLEKTVAILEQIAAALDYAHEQGMIHRDIKPANIILRWQGDDVKVTLLDFGLVKALAGSSALTSQGMLIGSPEYMSPEQADLEHRQNVGLAADRYSLGVLAYRILTGRVPFPGNTPATLNAHENKPVPDPRQFRPDIPDEVAAALLKMLSKEAGARFSTGGDFVAQLRLVSDAQVNRQHRDVDVQALYARLEQATHNRQWRDALALANEIQSLDRHYRDVQARIDDARRALGVTSATPVPRRAWIKRGGALLVVMCILFMGGWSWGWFLPTTSPPRWFGKNRAWVRPTDGMVMVYVKPGSFLMGNAEGDLDEQPVHEVTLTGFWIDQTEVTTAQYADYAALEGYSAQVTAATHAQHPVTSISWNDAKTYCEWVGARLPTEAEWEYAYRGPESRLYPWPGDFDGTKLNFCDASCEGAENQAVTIVDGYPEVAPVGQFQDGATWCHVLDMAGNVWEWVADWQAEGYPDQTEYKNPTGPTIGSQRILRGGSWFSNAERVRGSYRFWALPTATDATWGFRCVWPEK